MAGYSLDERNPAGLKQNALFLMLNTLMPKAFRLLGRVAPIWNVPGKNFTIVTGFDQVQEVFSRPKDFEVPYEKHMEVLQWDNFLLAMQDTPQYHHIHANTMRLWRPGDADWIASITRSTIADILASGTGTIELIQDVAKPVLLAIVEQYYGVAVPDDPVKRRSFFDGNLAASGFVFTGPSISDKAAKDARAAVDAVWPVIDAAMDAARTRNAGNTGNTGTEIDPTERVPVIDRYYQGDTADFTEDEMRSSLLAMIGGYLPTDTNATGRVMQILMNRPEAMSYVRDAVREGDDAQLLRGVLEALRLNFIIPMLWRRAAGNQLVGEGKPSDDRYEVGGNRILAVSLQAAMFDRRRVADPKSYEPDRPPGDSMVYGHQFHYCVGATISNAILTEMFRALIGAGARQPADKSLQKIRWVGMYPWTMWIDYDLEASEISP